MSQTKTRPQTLKPREWPWKPQVKFDDPDLRVGKPATGSVWFEYLGFPGDRDINPRLRRVLVKVSLRDKNGDEVPALEGIVIQGGQFVLSVGGIRPQSRRIGFALDQPGTYLMQVTVYREDTHQVIHTYSGNVKVREA